MTVTVFDLASNLYALGTGPDVLGAHKRGENLARATDGLNPMRPAATEGLYLLTPENLLTLKVAAIDVNGRVTGYQRPLKPAHARKIARALIQGKPFPPIILAVDGHGNLYIVEGQHRAVGAVMARVPIEAVIKRMNKDQQREMFAGQRRAAPVDANVLILAGTGPFERYIQEACSTSNHAWSEIASANLSAKTRITPHMMMGALVRYVANTESHHVSERHAERWDRALADELAPMIACFGNKQTNPLAFNQMTFRAIASSAMWVFRRNEHRDDDHGRWLTHMPKFAFDRYLFVRNYGRMTDELLAHWNKRLSSERRVTR